MTPRNLPSCSVRAILALCLISLGGGCACFLPASDTSTPSKPVLLYSLYYNAEGENRYPVDGVYSEVVKELGKDFEVRAHREPLNPKTLADVNLVLIANANEQAVPGHPPPPHVSDADIKALTRFVQHGGGLIVMQNQENHNVEVEAMNRLLARFGIQTTNLYTDAKLIAIPREAPVLGGLRWAYIIGNSIRIDPLHPAKPRAIVTNDLNQKPLRGARNEPGILLATAEPGQGRLAVVTDSGWLINAALNGEEAGVVVIKEHDNREIIRRLTRWAARLPTP
ncbi:MAG: hypothetical protein HY735_22260 [Verrucomicrobia bacterium]|nr:hypothetical protein [Verrucomicrobiota bacterium]